MNSNEKPNLVVIELTPGNIRNNHIYLATVMNFFPSSCIGGSSIEACAPQMLELDIGFGEPIETDIDGSPKKKIFRKRAWVRQFFERNELKPGDKVVIERTREFRYHIYPTRD